MGRGSRTFAATEYGEAAEDTCDAEVGFQLRVVDKDRIKMELNGRFADDRNHCTPNWHFSFRLFPINIFYNLILYIIKKINE